jgi:ferritin
MAMSDELAAAFNDQIVMEFASMYAYLQMAAHFESANLPGFAAWMRLQADEERGHAMRFFDFVLERGADVRLGPIDAPQHPYRGPLESFRRALAQERAVTGSIHALMDRARAENDYASEPLLQWFVAEQVEEEATVESIVERLELAGDDASALLLLDHQLGSRSDG